MNIRNKGLVLSKNGFNPHLMYAEPEFNKRAVLQCRDKNKKIAINFCKTPEGYIELNWCKDCLVKRADKIIKDPYLQLCTVTSDNETITKMNVLFTKYAPPKIKISIVNM